MVRFLPLVAVLFALIAFSTSGTAQTTGTDPADVRVLISGTAYRLVLDVPATSTPVPSTVTSTPLPSTATSTQLPAATNTALPPTSTTVPSTTTPTSVPSTATPTPASPTATSTAVVSGTTVNLADFGGSPAISDNATALKNAIATGKQVVINAGVFNVSTIELPAGAIVNLVGQGKGVTTLRHRNTSTQSMLHAEYTNGVPRYIAAMQIRNLTIDGNHQNTPRSTDRAPIDVFARTFTIDSVEFVGGYFSMIINGVTGDASITNSTFRDLARYGSSGQFTAFLQLYAVDPTSGTIRIANNTFTMAPTTTRGGSVGGIISEVNQYNAAIQQKLLIEDNTFTNIGQDPAVTNQPAAPIYLYRNADGSIVRRNTIINSYQSGIKAMRTNNLLIEDNVIDGQGALKAGYQAAISYSPRDPYVANHDLIVRRNTVKNITGMQSLWMQGYNLSTPIGNITITNNTFNNGIDFHFFNQQVTITDNATPGGITITQGQSGSTLTIGRNSGSESISAVNGVTINRVQ